MDFEQKIINRVIAGQNPVEALERLAEEDPQAYEPWRLANMKTPQEWVSWAKETAAKARATMDSEPPVAFEDIVEKVYMDNDGLPFKQACGKAIHFWPAAYQRFLSVGGSLEDLEAKLDSDNTFEAKVDEFMKAGHGKSSAVLTTARRFPELHREYVERLRGQTDQSSGRSKPKKSTQSPAQSAWLDAVRNLQSSGGLSLAKASAEIERTRPELRQALLAEAKSR